MADLERWGARLTAVAGAWPKDREIQLQQAMGAVNAINHYGAKGLMADLERWRARLAAVALAHPGHLGIQEWAAKAKLGYAQMHASGHDARP